MYLKESTPNKGDALEAILACALVSRLLKPNKEFINVDDIFSTIDNLHKQNKKIFKKDEIYQGLWDNIEISISVPKAVFLALHDKSYRDLFKQQYKQAVEFANSKKVTHYVDLVDYNSKHDIVIVKSVGTESQKTTKVDLQVLIGMDNNKPELTNLNFSLKYKSKTLESVGKSYERQKQFWGDLGVDISGFLDKDDNQSQEQWITELLEYVSTFLNKKIFLNDDKEYDFVKHIVDFINQVAKRKDDTVDVVYFDDKGFSVYDFKGLYDKLKTFQFQSVFDKKGRPKIKIIDKITKKGIIQIRTKFLRNKNTNIMELEKLFVEVEPLLKQLLTPSNISECYKITFMDFLNSAKIR